MELIPETSSRSKFFYSPTKQLILIPESYNAWLEEFGDILWSRQNNPAQATEKAVRAIKASPREDVVYRASVLTLGALRMNEDKQTEVPRVSRPNQALPSALPHSNKNHFTIPGRNR